MISYGVLLMEDYIDTNFDKVIFVTCDGDYRPTVKFLLKKNKFLVLLAPTGEPKVGERNNLSSLLRSLNPNIIYLDEEKKHLQREKGPSRD